MKRLLTCLLLIIPVLTFAQSNFKKGYILTPSRDTLRGYINYKERLFNPSSVSFRSSLNSSTETFTKSNCLGYGIDGIQSFEKFAVKVSTGSVNTSNLKRGRDTSAIRDTVFLRTLQKGDNINLYAYTDVHKTRFYISEGNNKAPYELLRYLYLDTTVTYIDKIVDDKVYTRQLQQVIIKLNKGVAQDQLRNLQYTESDLGRLVSVINGKKVTKSTVSHARFFAGIGLNKSSGFYLDNNFLANDAAVSKQSYSPVFNVGIDLMANPAIGKVVFRIGLSYFMSKNEISTTTDNDAFARVDHVYDEHTIALSTQFFYNFYNTKTFKLFGGIGFGANISSYSNNLVTRFNSVNQVTSPSPYQVSFDGFSPSTPITVGVVFNKRIEIAATYVPSTTTAHYDDFSVHRKRSEIGLKYLFGGH